MRMAILPIAIWVSSVAGAQATAQASDCSTAKPALPPELAGWSRPTLRTAGRSTEAATRVALSLGEAAQLRLTPTPSVRYAVSPEKPGAPASHGGLVSFTVTRPGTYRVALGAAAWIDVIRDEKPATSVAHGHGPACSGIRKMVDFRLEPGRYLLQVAGAADPVIPVMVAALR